MTAANINMVINNGTHYFHGDETDSYSANYNHTKTYGIYCNSNLTVSGSGTFNVYGYDENTFGYGYTMYLVSGKTFNLASGSSAALNLYGSKQSSKQKNVSSAFYAETKAAVKISGGTLYCEGGYSPNNNNVGM